MWHWLIVVWIDQMMTSDEFRAARHDLGMTQRQLAACFDVSESTIQNYEGARGSSGVPRVVELAIRGLVMAVAARELGLLCEEGGLDAAWR